MKSERIVTIRSEAGTSIDVSLFFEGGREAAVLLIDGVRYHFERISRKQLLSEYRVDTDPDYRPQSDAEDYCYILAPFSNDAAQI